MVDYDFVRADINAHKSMFNIEEIAIDPWNMAAIAPKLIEDGFEVVQVRQGFASLTTPSKEFEKMIIEGNLIHDSNPVMRWCVGNAVAEIDPSENKKPSKKKSTGRIDGVAAAVTALSRVLDRPQEFRSVYEDRGILFF